MVTSVVTTIAVPALLISHLSEQHVSFEKLAAFTGLAALAIGTVGVLAAIVLRLMGLSVRTYTGAMMLANVGNVGLPVCSLAFGEEGLSYAMGFYIVVVIGVFTVGEWIPQGTMSLSRLASSPMFYSVVIGVGLMAFDLKLPAILSDTLSILGGAAIPLMLITLGVTIASLTLENVRRGAVLSLLHLALAGGVAATVVALAGLTGTARAIFILQSLMPCSVFSYLMAMKHMPENGPDVASLVLVSTLLTIVVLPLALTYWI
ncbi:transporter [Stappia sp. GBMRC 2046]|uniref:Transporter n=1 Tax=Stappia sediminis TaxID=2692190 RepID=A0A7X3LTY0_9HYPH|nr:AEC family transporter [Stappia sediminis]MXN65061.1 transporter [Stappia sediminis]